MTQAAYARHRGVTKQAINQAVREGRIPITQGKRINVAKADAAWAVNTSPTVGGDRREKGGQPLSPLPVSSSQPRVEEPAADDLPPDLPTSRTNPVGRSGEGSDTQTLVSVKVRRELVAVEREEMDLACRRRQLLDATEVRKAIDTVTRDVRDKLLALPRSLAPGLAPAQPPAQVEATLSVELRRVLDELARIGSTLVRETGT